MTEELPLRDIHLPNPISWWPLTSECWLLIAIIILLVSFLSWWMMRPSLKKEALEALAAIEHAFQESENGAQCVADLSILLRRVVMSERRQLHKKNVCLTGEAWLNLLDKKLKTPEFSQGVGKILISGPYQPYVHPDDVKELLALSKTWVRKL